MEENKPDPLNRSKIVQRQNRTIPNLGNKTIDGDLIPFNINRTPTTRRISIVETIVHQAPKSNPVVIETRLSQMIKSDEEPYFRPRLKVGNEWIKIDTGWLDGSTEDKQVGRIVIKNHGPDRETQGNLTKKEKEQIEGMYLELSIGCNMPISNLIIPVNDSIRICQVNIEFYLIRCPNGNTKISILALPK